MNVAGHLAVSLLLGRRVGRASVSAWAPVLVGTLAPDVLDKAAMLARVTPYGRTVGHSLLLWAAAALAVRWARARGARAGWALGVALGGAAHLVTDLVDDVVEGLSYSGYAFSGWMGWPWTNPDMLELRVPSLLGPHPGAPTALELLAIGAAAWALFAARRDAR